MKVGFTGTRKGMTDRQRRNFVEKLYDLTPTEFHHGDCVGADDDAHGAVEVYNFLIDVPPDNKEIKIHIHPPEDDSLQAHNDGEVSYKPLTYLARNRQIVKHADIMIACPPTNHEIKKGGTWYTIDHSRKQGVPVWILYPNGEMELQ